MNVGDHVLVDGRSPATIRYLGEVDKHPGLWVGVEWWYQQGKHDGTLNGKFYFKTEKAQSASFIRAERIEFGQSFSSAIYRQYVKSFDHEHMKDDIHYSLFGKTYDDYAIELSSLTRVDLSTQWLNKFDGTESIYTKLDQIKELNIRQNLLKFWSDLWIVLDKYFPGLESLNVSNCRMIVDDRPGETRSTVKELVLIDTLYECSTVEELVRFFPQVELLYLDKNRISSISDRFVDLCSNLTSLSLSENVTLRDWQPDINRLGKLSKLEELILNQCAIDKIDLVRSEEREERFVKLKHLYLSDNKISSFDSIDQLSTLKSLTSLSLLRNPIYSSPNIDIETVQQLIIARLPNLTHLNRVFIERDERRGAEIDYLQRHADDYFKKRLDFHVEHRQYLRLIEKYGEPCRRREEETSKKGLCIRSKLVEVEFQHRTEKSTLKKVPWSMTVGKIKTLVRKLYPSLLVNKEEGIVHLYVKIDDKHQSKLDDDYQEIQFYLDNQLAEEERRIEILFDID